MGQLEILSDTQGVDFGPYLNRILSVVRQNWYTLIPESEQNKRGKLAIEFAITKDGQVAEMRLVASSGDVGLDRPAWGSITNANPFPALPTEFTGKYLALRFRYYYNPEKDDLSVPVTVSAAAQTDSPLGVNKVPFCRGGGQDLPDCLTPPRQIRAPGPKYPKRERKAHREGTVVLGVLITENGSPTNLRVLASRGDDFDKAAMDAVKRWKFAPATKDGKPVRVEIAVEVAFHLT